MARFDLRLKFQILLFNKFNLYLEAQLNSFYDICGIRIKLQILSKINHFQIKIEFSEEFEPVVAKFKTNFG